MSPFCAATSISSVDPAHLPDASAVSSITIADLGLEGVLAARSV